MPGMKTSTIKNLLRERIDSWIESIKDENLKKLARRDTIISGGAIASALAGDKINDYDIYFRTRETAKAMAKYYCKEFIATVGERKAPNGRSVNPEVKVENRKNCKGEEEERVIIYMKSAGVAGEQQEEYEYFETSEDAAVDKFFASIADSTGNPIDTANEVVVALKSKEKYRPVFLSENAITLSDRVQLVVRFYGEPAKLHENYDFVHAMCYYDYDKHLLNCPAEALESILSKSLIYGGSLYPIASLFRIRKFIERGWRITAGQMLKIIFQVSKLDLSDTSVLRDQLLGVDQAYMWQLIRALENKEANQKIDATYIAKLVDEIFE
jgi:hypothetical protein